MSLLRRIALLCTVCSAGAGIMLACSSFDSDSATNEPPATPDASTGDAPGVETDASAPDGDAALPPLGDVCPAPPFADGCEPGTGASACSTKTLYVPAAGAPKEFPFGLTTDLDHVYWLTQVSTAAYDTPYDGKGEARVMRVDRVGADNAVRATELANGQVRARAIALAGDYVYWATWKAYDGGPLEGKLLRVRRDCDGATCVVEDVVSLPFWTWHLRRASDNLLVAMGQDGQVVRVSLSPPSASSIVTTVGQYADFALTSDSVYATSANNPSITQIPLAAGSGATSFTSFPPDSGTNPGTPFIATDCTSLVALRGSQPTKELWSSPLASPTLTPSGPVTVGDTFDFTLDSRYFYAASANAGGIYAISRADKIPTAVLVRGGNVFNLTVDGAGVYWGEHIPADPGAIWMMVKP